MCVYMHSTYMFKNKRINTRRYNKLKYVKYIQGTKLQIISIDRKDNN